MKNTRNLFGNDDIMLFAPNASATKATAPKVSAPNATAPKATPTKATAPKVSAPKATPTKATAPNATAPKATPTKATAPKATAPKVGTRKASIPSVGAPIVPALNPGELSVIRETLEEYEDRIQSDAVISEEEFVKFYRAYNKKPGITTELTRRLSKVRKTLEWQRQSYDGFLGDLEKKLAVFEGSVESAIKGSHDEFRKFLRRCVQGELSEEQTIRLLRVCKNFERDHIKPKVFAYSSGAELRQKQNDNDLSLKTARVVVLTGIVFYLGEGIKRDLKLARQYFYFAQSMRLQDADLMLGYMATRGHGEVDQNKDASAASAEIFSRIAQVDSHQKAIMDRSFPSDVPILTQQWAQETLAHYDEAKITQAVVYPGQLAEAALALMQSMMQDSYTLNLTPDQRKEQVIKIASLLYRAHQTLLRTGMDLRQRSTVALLMAKFYEDRNKAYKDELSSEDLQEMAIYAQYFYGLIDPSIYDSLSNAVEDNHHVLTCILRDSVSSSRQKMRRIIALVGTVSPDYLFAGYPDALENLGRLAYQALADTLTLISYSESETENELLKEFAEYQSFVNSILNRLLGRKNNAFVFNGFEFSTIQDLSNGPQEKNQDRYRRLQKKGDQLFFDRYKQMMLQGPAGFAHTFRLLMGTEMGSQKLSWTTNPVHVRTIIKLLTEVDLPSLLSVYPDFLPALKILVIGKIAKNEREAFLDREFELCQDQYSKGILFTTDVELAKETLNTLQTFVDFCRFLEDAVLPPSHSREHSQDLYKLCKANLPYIRLIEKAIERYQASPYLPRKRSFFKQYSKDYAEQLALAHQFLAECEKLIFDEVALLKNVQAFFLRNVNVQEPLSFVLVLMKVLTEGDEPFLPLGYFDITEMKKRFPRDTTRVYKEFCDRFSQYFLPTSVSSDDESLSSEDEEQIDSKLKKQ